MTPAELEALARALGGRRCGRGWSCRCPAHDDRDPSLSLALGADGRLLVHCFANCDPRAVLAELRARGLLPDRDAPRHRPDPLELARLRAEAERREAEHEARRRRIALEVWHRAAPIRPGDPVDRYLRNRGLRPLEGGWPIAVRTGRDRGGPCMIAALADWPERRIVGVQITRLTPDGRKREADPPVRRTLGRLRGAAVPIRATGSPIVLAEGAESALACGLAAPSAAVLACLGAHNAAHLAVPTGAEVVLALDADPAGEAAARAAAASLAARGATVRIARLPPGRDPLEVFVGDAA